MSRVPVVIDTNVVFKALRLKYFSVREVLNQGTYHFYAPKFLLVEIFKHKEKLLKNNSQSEDEFYEYLNLLFQRITFVNEEIISIGSYLEAYRLGKDIDEKDVPFVALAIQMNCELWTYDQPIREGLSRKGFNHFFEI
ncbi:MAG: PIN domain-containing protein [Spirosomataceae bacterium]